VTCCSGAVPGIGDENDDWIIHAGTPSRTWDSGLLVILRHRLTAIRVLHSHRNESHPIFTGGDQEVTANPCPPGDGNDYWKCYPAELELCQPKYTKPERGKDKWSTIAAVNIAGSIASITGWTLLALGQHLPDQTIIGLAAAIFSAALMLAIIGILTERCLGWSIGIWRWKTPRTEAFPMGDKISLWQRSGILILLWFPWVMILLAGLFRVSEFADRLMSPFLHYVTGQ
jgi:hypothetical protein